MTNKSSNATLSAIVKYEGEDPFTVTRLMQFHSSAALKHARQNRNLVRANVVRGFISGRHGPAIVTNCALTPLADGEVDDSRAGFAYVFLTFNV